MANELNAMTLGELKQMVENLIDEHGVDTKIASSYEYGDHWGSEVVGTFDEAEECFIKYSDYHRKFKVVDRDMDEEQDDLEEDEEFEKVLILK